MAHKIWELVAAQVLEDLRSGARSDGRKFDEYRSVSISNKVSENADGSAEVFLGKTRIAVGIKLLPGAPYPDSPDEGAISVGTELLQFANPDFEVGPPRDDAIELARVVDRGIREAHALDFKKLCIEAGEKVWVAYIDAYVLNDDGNLFDACSLGSVSALLKCMVPKLDKEYAIVKGETSGKLGVDHKPVMCTFAKVSGNLLLDPTLAEQKAMTARFSLATTEDELITAYQKGGGGSFTRQEIDACIETAFKRGKELRKKL